jgi:hypothetical protein
MKRMKHLGAGVALGALLAASVLVSPASATVPTTTGTWQYRHCVTTSSTVCSDQTFTDSSSPSSGYAYRSSVRQPINADGSSNFNSKRGVIPVQFDLQSAPTTTTTTTRTYDPPVWDSLGSPSTFTFAALKDTSITVGQLTNLSATYGFTTGNCFGGSLRWDIFYGPSTAVHVYYGDPGGVQACPSQSGVNLWDDTNAANATNRFEIGSTGVYVNKATAVSAIGTSTITRVQLTLDSGWSNDQRANVSNVTVNDNTWVPKTTETLPPQTTTGSFASTCALPQAALGWAKNDNTAIGGVNEGESIQPKDTGQFYRQVDCKYIYNLDVSSLNGVGTYTVSVNIGGVNIQVPATFDLK